MLYIISVFSIFQIIGEMRLPNGPTSIQKPDPATWQEQTTAKRMAKLACDLTTSQQIILGHPPSPSLTFRSLQREPVSHL